MDLDTLLGILKFLGGALLTLGTGYIGAKIKTSGDKLDALVLSIHSLKTDIAVMQQNINTILTDVENIKKDNSQIREKTFDLDKRLSILETWKQHAREVA